MASFPVTNGVTTFLPPPEGYEVDFEHPQQHYQLDHFLIFGLLGFLALFCLIQRLYTKHFIAGGLKADDCMFRCENAARRKYFDADCDYLLQT